MLPAIQYEPAAHKGKNVIFIRFDYSPELNKRVKKLAGVHWGRSGRSWYVSDNKQYREKFGLEPKLPAFSLLENIHAVNQPAFQTLLETLQLMAYSPSTIKTYGTEFAQLLYLLKDKDVKGLDVARLRSYFLYCINKLKLSENTLHSRINAVKFYFEQVLKREKFFVEIPRPNKPSILPKVINARDIKRIFEVTVNLKPTPCSNFVMAWAYV